MSAEELADMLRVLDLSQYDMEEKFLLYSAAPGSGKGAIMDLTFAGRGSPYSDLVQRLILYHTREPRVAKGERDGVNYHFGKRYVGEEDRNRLMILYRDGKIYRAYVNKQLQGLAKDNFREVVKVHNDDPTEVVLAQDTVIGTGTDEFGEYTLVERPIKGLREAFGDEKITILEGGYGWYKSIRGDKDKVFTIFISPFTDEQLELRTKNKRIINRMFKDAEDRFKAYWVLNGIRKETGREEVVLQNNSALQAELRIKVQQPLEGFRLKEGAENARHNARMIESGQFVKDLNRSLEKYFEAEFRVNTPEEKALARELAYEVHMKLIKDRGEGSYRLERPSPKKERTADFTKSENAYNRVLEGVVQIMLRNEYKQNGTGAVVINQFVWSGNWDDIEKRIEGVSEDFCREYFVYLLKAIKRNLTGLVNDGVGKGFEEVVLDEECSLNITEKTWIEENVPELAGKTIVSLSMEGNIPELTGDAREANTKGGLGAYYGDKLEGLADIGMEAIGIQPMYTERIEQVILDSGEQYIGTRPVSYDGQPIEQVLDASGSLLVLEEYAWNEFEIDNDVKYTAEVYKVNRGGSICYLIYCPAVFDVLYTDNRRHRYTQEILYGRFVYQLLKKLNITPDILHLNEAHTVVAAARVRADDSFEKTAIVYTNHTIVPGGLERFKQNDVGTDVRRMFYQLGLDGTVAGDYWDTFIREDGVVDFCYAALELCDVCNGVSTEHAGITQRMFSTYPEEVIGILNGSGRFWKNSVLREKEDRGEEITEEILWDIHEEGKEDAFRLIKEKLLDKTRFVNEENVNEYMLDQDRPTVWLVRRMVDYKSQYPMLRWLIDIICADRNEVFTRESLIERWKETMPDMFEADYLKEIDRELDILFQGGDKIHGLGLQVVVGGIAHVFSETEEYWIKEFNRWMNLPSLKGRFVYVPDSDTELLRMQAIGADILLDCPLPHEEACGTSHQRSMMNGGVVVGNLTGGVVELVTDENGFPYGPFESGYDFYSNAPSQILDRLTKASQEYYEEKRLWAERMHNAYVSANAKVTAWAMEERYARKVYTLAIQIRLERVRGKSSSGIKRKVQPGQEPVEIGIIEFGADGAQFKVQGGLARKEVAAPEAPVVIRPSADGLKNKIISQIQARSGKITYAEFVDFVLKDKDFGFYGAGKVKFHQYYTEGERFATDAMDPEFAIGLARQLYSMWELMGNPEKFDIVEMGAGDGTLCLNILNYIRDYLPDFYQRVNYIIVEVSSALVNRQKEKILIEHSNVSWKLQSAVDKVFEKGEINGVFISSELVDAFNTHRVVYDAEGDRLQEIYVGYDSVQDVLYEIVDNVSDPRIIEYMQVIFDETGRHPGPDTEIAVCLEMLDWIKNVSEALNRGFVVTFDYGHTDWESLLTTTGPSVYNFNLPGIPKPLFLGRDLTFWIDFPSLSWYGKKSGLKEEWFGDAGNYMSRFSDMRRVSRSDVLVQSKGVSEYVLESVKLRSVVRDILRYLQGIGLQKGALPSIPLEGDMEVGDILEGFIMAAQGSESQAEEVLVNLIVKGDGLEGHIKQAVDEIDMNASQIDKLESIMKRANAMKTAEEKALAELELITGGKTFDGVNINIIDAHALVSMRESEAKDILGMLASDPGKAVAVIIFDKEDEGILRVVNLGKVTVVRAGELNERLPEEVALEKIKRERFGGKEININDISILASLENVVKGRWRMVLAEFHYVILNNRSLTNTALLNMYQALPSDIRSYLSQAGLNIDVIERSTISEERFEPERYEHNAVTEISKAA